MLVSEDRKKVGTAYLRNVATTRLLSPLTCPYSPFLFCTRRTTPTTLILRGRVTGGDRLHRVAKRPLHSKRAEAAQSPGTLILAKAPQLQADFSRPRGGKRGGFVGKAHRPKAQRFPQNPEADWGPKARARHALPPAAAAATAAATAAAAAAAPEVAPGHENAEEANACDAEPASKKAKF